MVGTNRWARSLRFGRLPMYIPAAFAEPDLATLHDFIEAHSFGMLVTQVEGQPFVSHLPFLLDRSAGPRGALIGHMARANPQWQSMALQIALAVFSGPHAYISPAWYEAENVVPTWNYIAVHAYGVPALIEDGPELLSIVEQSVQLFERSRSHPWVFEHPSVFVERLLEQIVGFRIPIDKIEGKWKLNQNHPVERRRKVAAALNQRGDENSREIATAMIASLPEAEGT